MMKVEHSLEVSVPDERPTLATASSCPSLASSRESVLDEPTDTGLHETANAEICSLKTVIRETEVSFNGV